MTQVVQFAPVVYFHQLECFNPCNIEYLLQNSTLHIGNQSFVRPDQQTLESNPGVTRDPADYLDLTGGPTSGSVSPPMYVCVQVPSDASFVDLNFYILMPFNGNQCVHVDPPGITAFDCSLPTFANHQGDIEGITVRLDPTLKTVIWVRYEAHGTSVFYPPDGITWWQDQSGIQTTNPVVYSALYSHATYPGVGPAQSGNYVVVDTMSSVLQFSDYIRPTKPAPWVPFTRANGQSSPSGNTLFVGLDGNGNPVGDQIWAKYAGFIGKTLQNSFDSDLGVQPIGQALTKVQSKFANALATSYSSIWKHLSPERFIGEGPVGLGARASIQMTNPCWQAWMGNAVASPYHTLPLVGTPPAVVAVGDVVVMVWAMGKLQWAYYQMENGQGDWTTGPAMPIGSTVFMRPALAVFNNTLYMMYADTSGTLHYATLNFTANPDPSTWTWVDQGSISWTTCAGPSLAVFEGTLYAVYVGTGDNGALYWGTFDGTSWKDQSSILNKGLTSSAAPALAAYETTLYLLYRGTGNDYIYLATYTPGTGWVNPQQNTVSGQTTGSGPALVVADGTLYLIYLSSGSPYIYCTFLLDDNTWSAAQRTMASPTNNDASSASPSVTAAPDAEGVLFYMAYLDNDTSGLIWLNTCSAAGV
jgi:hypothetical protein